MRKYFKIILSELLHVFGALWLSVNILSFYGNVDLSIKIKSLWWVFLLIGIIIIIIRLVPKKKFKFPISERDCRVEVVIGDLFKQEGSIIAGTNTSFEVDPQIISPKSIQGQFCEKYYKDTTALKSLINSKFTSFPVDFGTTLKIKGTGKTGYFCALAKLNSSNVAISNFQNLQISLGGLWDYLSSNSEKETINIPIIGSGFSRLKEKREVIAKEIIRSFIASISDNCFCDCLRIIISPSDIKSHTFDIEEFLKFVGYATQFASLKPISQGTGQELNV
jgi:hypothetical protein